MSSNAPSDWYINWFGKEYLELYRHRDDREAKLHIDFITEIANLSKSSKILDIACGRGRHVYHFAKRGLDVVGIDRSYFALCQANESLKTKNNRHANILQADMRDLPFKNNSFDLITSLFTSFGYFPSDSDHEKLLHAWQRLLKPNGSLILDYLNKDYVINNLIPSTRQDNGEHTIIQTRYLHDNATRINKDIQIVNKNGEVVRNFTESVRMYSLDKLQTFLDQAGFVIKNTYGNFKGERFSKDSSQLIILAKVK